MEIRRMQWEDSLKAGRGDPSGSRDGPGIRKRDIWLGGQATIAMGRDFDVGRGLCCLADRQQWR